MPRYLVGSGSNTWNFNDAYNAAQNGDVIEFQKGYVYELASDRMYNIKKNLHFIGHVEVTDSGRTFHNTINAKFHVTNGAKVTFENLWFSVDAHRAALYLSGGADVTCKQVYFEETIQQNKQYIVYVENDSKLTILDSGMKIVDGATAAFYAKSSTVKIESSTILSKLFLKSGSNLTLKDVYLEKFGTNTINARDSYIKVEQSTIKGGDSQKDLPTVWLKNTIWESTRTNIIQPQYYGGVCLNQNVQFQSKEDVISSISSYHSLVKLNETTIGEILSLKNESYGILQGTVDFLGENKQKIDILSDGNSAIFANEVVVHRIFEPNFRVGNSSYLQIASLQYPEGGVEKLKTEVSQDSSYIVHDMGSSSEEMNHNALEELNGLIGLDKVKQEINKMIRMVEFNKKRIKKGMAPERQTLHSVFMGNPGTGKTTVARLLGEVLFEHGVLTGSSFRFIEATESDLISSSVGGTAEQTQSLLEQAKGGILFIDEAYTLNKKGSVDFGIEAINTILKYMEDNRDDIMIIFAGYTKEMEQFLQTNPGLKSRVPNVFMFEDYSGDEIVELGVRALVKGDYKLEDEDYYAQNLKRAYGASLDKSNGRWVRNVNEKLTKTLAERVIEENSEDVETILNVDIDSVFKQDRYQEGIDNQEDAMESLNNLIGISKVKSQVKEFIDSADFNKKRAEQGIVVDDTTLHSLFLGNPGTGKTTVARIVGKILYQKGIISQNKFIEVSRSDLVGGYIGHTAIKTKEVLESALGGVLFIDEAYTLSTGGDNDFGKEAINEILKFMEDHRRDLVIIFAGYTKEMSEFLQMNSGLKSRIPTVFDFEDYTPEEIVDIGLLGLHKQGYQVNEQFYGEVLKHNYQHSNDHSNGRWVRNQNERLLRQVSTRVTREGSTDYNSISDTDLENIREK